MKRIGFDLDGIFVNDVTPKDGEWNDIEQWHLKSFRERVNPLFCLPAISDIEWFIITARPMQDSNETRRNIVQILPGYFEPDKIILRTGSKILSHHEAAEYKWDVIQEKKLDVFVESDSSQVFILEQLSSNSFCQIYHFKKLVEDFILGFLRDE